MKDFIRAALIRAGRTAAQTALSVISTSAVILSEVNWLHVASAAVLGAILSILTSIATGLPEVKKNDGA